MLYRWTTRTANRTGNFHCPPALDREILDKTRNNLLVIRHSRTIILGAVRNRGMWPIFQNHCGGRQPYIQWAVGVGGSCEGMLMSQSHSSGRIYRKLAEELQSRRSWSQHGVIESGHLSPILGPICDRCHKDFFTRTVTMSQELDAGTAVADVAILTSAAYVNNDKKANDSGSFDEKVSISDLEKSSGAIGIDHGDDIVDVKGDDDDPAYAALPRIVRELCDFEDDPTTPVLTWRFFVLSGAFTALGAWLTQMGFFRTTYIPYSVYFVQIASLYCGKLMAASLPSRKIGFGKYSFELNPGPFTIKEHVAIVLAANTGATNNLGDYVLSPLAVFYGQPMNGWLAILFMWSAVFIGFSLATLARTFLIDNPVTTFPLVLQQVSVFNAMRASFETGGNTVKRQMRVFWYGILILFLWEFLPEYIFPFTSSLAFLCWVTDNPTANFLGSGLGGAGLLNITLDWSNIGSTFVYYPYWAQVNLFVAFVLGAWILVPIGAIGGAWQNDLYPMQSQSLFLTNGSRYPTAKLMNADYTINEELFAEIGAPKMSAQLRWGYFFSQVALYTAYLGAFVSLCLFQGPLLWKTFKSIRTGQRLYNDKLCQLMEPYPKVPLWWNIILFLIPSAVIIALAATGKLYLPLYTVFIALGFGALIVVPMAYIYAVSGYQIPVGYFNELLYGYMINAGGSRHPVGSLSYRTISGQCWYEACSMLADMKLGHYFHIPPRATLFAQVWGILVGVPVNYATILWVCFFRLDIPSLTLGFPQIVNTKGSFLDGTEIDPNNQWTGQSVISLNNQGIAFGLVGPKKLFADEMYNILPYGFVLGAGIPIILYLLHRKWPRARFDLWNIPIFATTMENFYGNISNFVFTWFILGSINHLYLKKYKYKFWKTYAYIAGAAADTGFNLNMLMLFIAFSAAKVTVAPHWWGNNADSVERCFPANSGA
ncbi:OPT oligopeptide transporter protein-domain-containing protein [Mycena capillaripes]|nr:OPT oligopeptide transporter protein-domain-containing protein [Mycena capillaripes]